MVADNGGLVTNVTIDADGWVLLPYEALRALRPRDERLTLLDVRIDGENGALTVRRSGIDEEDWWAYTPEHQAAIVRAKHSRSYRMSSAELEALVEADDPQEALAVLLETKRNERVD
jgi:hypothetical protein